MLILLRVVGRGPNATRNCRASESLDSGWRYHSSVMYVTRQGTSFHENFSLIATLLLTSQSNDSARKKESTRLPYWRIYRQYLEIWRILKAFGYKYFGLANFWRFFESIWLQIFWFGEMYDLYICTYLLTYM